MQCHVFRKTIRIQSLSFILAAVAIWPHMTRAVTTAHPGFTFKNILPVEMKDVLGLGGIDFLPNGDGVVCTWGGVQKSIGELWLIPNLASGSPGAAYRMAQGLREPLGVKVVGQDIYLMEKPGIFRYSRKDSVWTRSKFFSLPSAWYDDLQWFHFSYGLEWRDSAFWFISGAAFPYTYYEPRQRGALIRVPLDGSGYSLFARGMYQANGLGLGPEQQFFATDNEGYFKPANALLHFPTRDIPKDGRFFGYRTLNSNACGTTAQTVDKEICPEDPEYPPAVWIPYGKFSASLTRPVLLKKGVYAGQMLSGDVTLGGLFRFFLERVEGEYQGAVFPFMNAGLNGIPYGVHQFIHTSSGDMIGIGIGNACNQGGEVNWSVNKTCRGMHLFSPTDSVPFEMKAIRATASGFQIEFTRPAGSTAESVSNYSVRTTVFTSSSDYGRDASTRDNNIPVEVTEARMSEDGRFVEIKMASLETRRMYAITLGGITSAQGDSLYANVGYYTLNQVPKPVAIEARVPGPFPNEGFGPSVRWEPASRRISILIQQPYQLALKTLAGVTVQSFAGDKPLVSSLAALKPGLYVLTGIWEGKRYSQRLVLQ